MLDVRLNQDDPITLLFVGLAELNSDPDEFMDDVANFFDTKAIQSRWGLGYEEFRLLAIMCWETVKCKKEIKLA